MCKHLNVNLHLSFYGTTIKKKNNYLLIYNTCNNTILFYYSAVIWRLTACWFLVSLLVSSWALYFSQPLSRTRSPRRSRNSSKTGPVLSLLYMSSSVLCPALQYIMPTLCWKFNFTQIKHTLTRMKLQILLQLDFYTRNIILPHFVISHCMHKCKRSKSVTSKAGLYMQSGPYIFEHGHNLYYFNCCPKHIQVRVI